MSQRVKVRTRFPPGVGGFCEGSITMPAPGVSLTVSAVGADRAEALQMAAQLAENLMKNPLVAAIMPPQAVVAVKAIKTIAKAARRGRKFFKSIWGRFRGKGKRRLAKALAMETPRSPRLPPVERAQPDDEGEADEAPEDRS